jgi:hypothetical protein
LTNSSTISRKSLGGIMGKQSRFEWSVYDVKLVNVDSEETFGSWTSCTASDTTPTKTKNLGRKELGRMISLLTPLINRPDIASEMRELLYSFKSPVFNRLTTFQVKA